MSLFIKLILCFPVDETSEQEQKHKEINNSNAQNPSAGEGNKEQVEEILPLTLE